MNFQPESWLEVAEICCSNIPDVSREALLRTALNRAYYAALLELKARIEMVQGPGAVPAWATHAALQQAVRTAGTPFREINYWLETLRKERETCDYVLESREIERSHVRRLIGKARWLIRNRIKALPDAEFRRLHVPRG